MAGEAQNYMFVHKELVGLLVKAAGIHEGRWCLAVQLGMSQGNFGPSADQLGPGIAVAVNRIGIQRVSENAPPTPEALTVDAAQVNPVKEDAIEK